ncbi:MAG: hypothetical protein QM401_11985 [Bacillota bacterium]|nr:hypothetical protein [Bacillota bacterium]HHU61303.1 hypothetical protein [Natronincola sp.]
MRILAIITLGRDKVASGVPIFYAKDQEEQDNLCLLLSRILGAAVHDLQNGVKVIVKH